MDHTWLASLESDNDTPNYYAKDPKTLITSSTPIDFAIGTGAQVLSRALKSCLAANEELIIVTCFWAKSKSQRDVASLLRELSQKSISRNNNQRIRVRLCFSSLSILQKLFQTSSLEGKIYPPSEWVKLGLPGPEELTGLDLLVKSIFVRPFSVMHPKFIIMDRKRAYLSSCNVSWEDWFEGCVTLDGEIVEKLFQFWKSFWGRSTPDLPNVAAHTDIERPFILSDVISQTKFPANITAKSILLPSPHHTNPSFRPFSPSTPPATPLNTYILHVLENAKNNSSIYIQTPNLTSRPFIKALYSAIQRGVHIHLITSRRLMILEQLVTAGTITEFEIWRLRRLYAKSISHEDPEAGLLPLGRLHIGYFKAKNENVGEPVKSHLKCMIVDEEVTILGSGNMDRASWYTSQELGVAIESKEVAQAIRKSIDEGLEGRVEYIC